ncbi:hypothetical protein EXQ42_01810 [Clostridium botulinum]|nr:hypothetical protein [Clostridium botulinum]MBO0573721.1 hypothetical protein [Clostridium botulinum]
MKIELNETILDKEGKSILSNFKKYRDYTTIRRNLCEAYDLINSVIELQNSIMSENNGLQKYQNKLVPAKVNFHYAIILYAKWFKATNNKTWIKKDKYFNGEKEKESLETHDYIIELRDKYIVHNEKNLIGGDKVLVDVDNQNNIKLISEWNEMFFPTNEKLLKIKKCIEIVHNTINNEDIPKYEKYLMSELKEKNIINKLINHNTNT